MDLTIECKKVDIEGSYSGDILTVSLKAVKYFDSDNEEVINSFALSRVLDLNTTDDIFDYLVDQRLHRLKQLIKENNI